MRKLHLIFGILVLIVFLLTGQYMDKFHNHLVGMPDGMRLLYRTRHIFILLSGLTHVGIGVYFQYRHRLLNRIVQLGGSALIVLASLLFIVAFFYEPKLSNLKTPLSHWGTYSIVAGVLFHLMSALGEDKRSSLDQTRLETK